MNIQEYAEAVRKIHSSQALLLWSFYQSRKKPLTKKYIIDNLPSLRSEGLLDELIAHLAERGFIVKIKE